MLEYDYKQMKTSNTQYDCLIQLQCIEYSWWNLQSCCVAFESYDKASKWPLWGDYFLSCFFQGENEFLTSACRTCKCFGTKAVAMLTCLSGKYEAWKMFKDLLQTFVKTYKNILLWIIIYVKYVFFIMIFLWCHR